MISLTIKTALISTLAIVALAASSANASEIIGVLDSSGNTPHPSEENPPALTGSMVANDNTQINESPDSPVNTRTPATEVRSGSSSSQMILSSQTDTTNLPAGSSLAEYAPLSNSENIAILRTDTASNTRLGASTIMGSIVTMSMWWWAITLFFVLILFTGLYAYRPRHNERRWINRQY